MPALTQWGNVMLRRILIVTIGFVILYWIHQNGRIERTEVLTDEEREVLAQRRHAPAPHSLDDAEDFLNREVWNDAAEE